MFDICFIYVLYMFYICFIYVLYMFYICFIYVLYMFYISLYVLYVVICSDVGKDMTQIDNSKDSAPAVKDKQFAAQSRQEDDSALPFTVDDSYVICFVSIYVL